jgi:aldose 1-epimerase
MPDAFGRVSSGMTVLEPGETQALTMVVRA